MCNLKILDGRMRRAFFFLSLSAHSQALHFRWDPNPKAVCPFRFKPEPLKRLV